MSSKIAPSKWGRAKVGPITHDSGVQVVINTILSGKDKEAYVIKDIALEVTPQISHLSLHI